MAKNTSGSKDAAGAGKLNPNPPQKKAPTKQGKTFGPGITSVK